MAFDVTDPRTQLVAAGPATAPSAYGPASYVKFYEIDPQMTQGPSKTWLARGAYFVVAYTEATSAVTLGRDEQPDEYMLLLPDPDTVAEVTAGSQRGAVAGESVSVIPPGPSAVTLPAGGRAVRIFSHLVADLALQAANAAVYGQSIPNLAPYEPWPEPPSGPAIRSYSLRVDPAQGRFGRIWRCSGLMVNYSYPRPGPRDVKKMSPHTHDDFEQGSLVLGGSFVHHLRYPWTTDMRTWRNDEHEICAGPSLAVIPPLAVHTSQQVGREVNQLVDIFGPPRFDFSRMDRWVLNADEYPMPGESA